MTDTWSVFDVIGPVMIGPSSSHTAGACKLGYFARNIFGETPDHVDIKLHGSFGDVCEGHCTDVAIIGGLLGCLPSDPKIRDAFTQAEATGMTYDFEATHLKDAIHPNTVRFHMQKGDRTQTITGYSAGGGKAIINAIDKIPVSISGAYSSLLICFDTKKCLLNDLLHILAQKNISIVNAETARYKNIAIADIEIKEWFFDHTAEEINALDGVKWARFVNHISHYD